MIPETVRIGAYTVNVEFDEHIMTDDGNCGYYNPRSKTIVLDKDLCPEFAYGVFCHELIEAIKDIYSITALQQDHHAIDLMGEALHQVLRDAGPTILPDEEEEDI